MAHGVEIRKSGKYRICGKDGMETKLTGYASLNFAKTILFRKLDHTCKYNYISTVTFIMKFEVIFSTTSLLSQTAKCEVQFENLRIACNKNLILSKKKSSSKKSIN